MSCLKWPFKRKPPPLHRALGAGADDDERRNETVAILQVEQLATKRRVRKKDALKRNALHVACANKPSLQIVTMLVAKYPAAIKETDKVGRLPLHSACANSAPLDVVEFLLAEYPESIMETTDRGGTPLFCAIENKAPLRLVKFLVEQDPESVLLTQYKLGRTPVHAAVTNGAPLNVVSYLLELRPLSMAEKDAWGKIPLACACMNAKEGDFNAAAILKSLLTTRGVQTLDRGGMAPLHIGCANAASMDNIHLLLDAYPDALRLPDNNGRLALHAACSNPRVDMRLLKFLIQAYPESLKHFDKYGALPLHIAIQRKCPTDVIMYLIDQAEGAARTREASSKMYPLHMACRSGADMALLEKLIDVYPEAIDAVDNNGNTFFHVACMCRTMTLEFVEFLLDKCSYASIRKTNEDGSLPLHIACQHRLDWEVIRALIERYREGLMAKDKRGNTPLHKAFQTSTELKTLVLIAHHDYRALNRKNKRGDTPEDCVSPLIQKKFRRSRGWYNLRRAYCPICVRVY